MLRHSYGIGAYYFNRKDLEKVKAEGNMPKITAIGLLHLSDDISPQLASQTIEKVHVMGVFRAPEAVKAALSDRIE